ncbi:purine-binding chemotaxis protein CheW [Clostridium sp. D2Q-11]|uniref:Purine-binding chemotaxis protein CheW n=1 Tax=Anaeromonas frigoriresistens TaxID=2683708 RepID=A0A942UQ33_9FIRM|nr:chemotaxis protein CheW [Anaeromonas frigoriresistens]MBS4537209.1 purine-binding chemotaxis protein CheW [Anaeromonas frigoriresistens]
MIERQFVVFKLDKEEYGIDIMNVKEIGPYQEPVKVPNSPAFIEGIVNYRGEVIPIVNLKKRFNLNELIVNKNTRVIVINIDGKQVGFIVDEASQTVRFEEGDIEKAPDIITDVDSEYIAGVGKKDERLILLIDLEKVLTESEKKKIVSMDLVKED